MSPDLTPEQARAHFEDDHARREMEDQLASEQRAEALTGLEKREAELYELLQHDPMNLGVLMRLNDLKTRLSLVRARSARAPNETHAYGRGSDAFGTSATKREGGGK